MGNYGEFSDVFGGVFDGVFNGVLVGVFDSVFDGVYGVAKPCNRAPTHQEAFNFFLVIGKKTSLA